MNICGNCFNDLELKKFIEAASSINGKCDYCNEINTNVLDLVELLDFFSEFLEIFEKDISGIPLINLLDQDWKLFSNKSIANKILIDVFSAITVNIPSPETSISYVFEVKSSISYWIALKKELKWEKRFLTNVQSMEDFGWETFFNEQIPLPEGEVLFRARIHKLDSQKVLSTDELGCPKKENVLSGRANPQGIPYLYLSRNVNTTFYETRVTYLDEVSVGSFRIKPDEKIVLVDFTASGSVFLNMGYIVNFAKGKILKKHISDDLSLPIRRYDSELEYIPTQFICEYIRYITNAGGIIFKSSLHEGGTNVVLFNENQVECFEVKKYRITNIDIVATPEA
jgi:hypothetical protein